MSRMGIKIESRRRVEPIRRDSFLTHFNTNQITKILSLSSGKRYTKQRANF